MNITAGQKELDIVSRITKTKVSVSGSDVMIHARKYRVNLSAKLNLQAYFGALHVLIDSVEVEGITIPFVAKSVVQSHILGLDGRLPHCATMTKLSNSGVAIQIPGVKFESVSVESENITVEITYT